MHNRKFNRFFSLLLAMVIMLSMTTATAVASDSENEAKSAEEAAGFGNSAEQPEAPATGQAADSSAGSEPPPEESLLEESEEPQLSTQEELTYVALSNFTVPNAVVTTTSTYPWSKVSNSTAIQSGNAKVSSSVSAIKVTVVGPGILSYSYRVYSSVSEKVPDSFLISVGEEITKDVDYDDFPGCRYYGETGWKSDTVSINAEDGVSTDIYFAYRKNGATDHEYDCALLKDMSFNSGKAVVTAAVTDENFGSVSGSGEYLAGETVTLTAEAKAGGKFFGWSRDGLHLSETGTTYSFTAGADVTVTAIFGSEADTVAQNWTTGALYTSAKAAIDDTHPFETLVLLKDAAISEDTTVPANVTLYVPYSAEYNALGNADGTTANHGDSFAPESETFCRLTINSGVTLDVKGELLIGGVISYPSQMYQGHTSGAHGRVTNNGMITVNGGRIDCYGFIDGSGTVEAVTGTVYEPFVVLDFAGGSNMRDLYFADQNSFRDYTMQNISCTLVINSAAALKAYCNLYASSQYNKTDLAVIGGKTTAPDGLVVLKDGATATRTVDKTKSLSGAVASGSYGSDLGKVKYTLSGGGTLNKLGISVYGFKISVDHFPIPYSYSYVLTNGAYTMPNGWDIMPGAELLIASGATLSSSGRLFVLDGLKCGDMSGKRYPSSEALAAAGYATCGVLTVDGALYLSANSTFGGIIQTNGTGAVHVPIGCTVATAKAQFGAAAYYDDNTCIMELNGRIRIGNELVQLEQGKIYSAANGDSWTLSGYTVTEYATDAPLLTTEPSSGKYGQVSDSYGNKYYIMHAENETVTTDQPMRGAFAVSGNTEDFISVCKTYYNENDTTRAAVSEPTISNNSVSFTVERTEVGKSYNFLVQYSIDGSDPVTITPDKTTGAYTINNVTGTVTVTVIAVKKGDVDLDGDITAADVTKLRRSLAKYDVITDPYSLRAADCDSDTDVTAADVTLLRRYLAKYISSL